jgi:hypothetical protein
MEAAQHGGPREARRPKRGAICSRLMRIAIFGAEVEAGMWAESFRLRYHKTSSDGSWS